jgi:hypothetical protein
MKSRVFLAAALIALTTAAVFAQTEADVDVIVANNAVTIDLYKGTAATVNIPARIRNMPVTVIGIGAFAKNQNIRSVTIPSGVVRIDREAFANCANLASVTIPVSVTTIESAAFANTGLTGVTIPAAVSSIENQAFADCYNLTSVTLAHIPGASFHANAFRGLGDLRDKFYAGGQSLGVAGTYTRPNGESLVWTKR